MNKKRKENLHANCADAYSENEHICTFVMSALSIIQSKNSAEWLAHFEHFGASETLVESGAEAWKTVPSAQSSALVVRRGHNRKAAQDILACKCPRAEPKADTSNFSIDNIPLSNWNKIYEIIETEFLQSRNAKHLGRRRTFSGNENDRDHVSLTQ